MNLKGLSGGGREIKLDFYNQKAIKTCRNPCKILRDFRVGVGVLLQNISREFYRLCTVCLAPIGQNIDLGFLLVISIHLLLNHIHQSKVRKNKEYRLGLGRVCCL